MSETPAPTPITVERDDDAEGPGALGHRIPALKRPIPWGQIAVMAPKETGDDLVRWLLARPRERTLVVKITTDSEGRWALTWMQEQPAAPAQPIVRRR